MSIEIHNETPADVDLEAVRGVAALALEHLQIHPDVELSIQFIDTEQMSQLHVQWMDLEGPTDVMSFPMDELQPGAQAGMLGDIVICPDVAQQQAEANGHSQADEIQLLTVHGVLHLAGYDHGTAEEKQEMFGKQAGVLRAWFARTEPERTRLPIPTES